MSLLLSTGAFASSLSAAFPPGMILMKPTSITHSGTSASLGANGQVTFTAVTSLSLNGCFTADFDNYVMSIRLTASAGINIRGQFRASGVDATTNYTLQTLTVNGASVSSTRATLGYFYAATAFGVQRAGSTVSFYGPFLSQPTAVRNIDAADFDSAYILDNAATHSTASSYDGVTLYTGSATTFTGALQVYGVRS